MNRATVLRWALPAGALFLVFLVLTLPARHVLGWAGGGQLAAQGIEGTPWHGRVQRLALQQTSVGPVVWQLQPLRLLLGRLEYHLFVQSGAGGGELRAGRGLFGAPYVRAAQLSLPAADLTRQLRLNLVSLGGDFLVDIDTLRLTGGWPGELAGAVRWQGARLVQPQRMSLGDLRMTLELRGGNIVGVLGDDGGPLELGGELTLGQDRRYRLEALLKPRAAAEQPLRDALKLLGNPDAQGRYRLQYSGAL